MNRLNGRWLAAGLIALALVAVRFVGIASYPGFDADEGFWAGGSRNFVLFGNALLDDRLDPITTPAHFVLLSGFFHFIPPSLQSARWFSATAGVLTCLLIALLARREFPRRPWLFVVLYGFSATLFFQRLALLEADQMLWLVLAAVLWLSPRRDLQWAAGAAYGLALLVKANSVYMLPVFLLSLPATGDSWWRSAWRRGLPFLALTALVAGGGYWLDCRIDPEGFVTVFKYQLDGSAFVDDSLLFHVGRFGLNPHRILGAVENVFIHDPLFILLAVAGIVWALRNLRSAARSERFFLAWVFFGGAFTLGQVLVEVRYLTTLTPALAFLAARLLDDFLSRQPQGEAATRGRTLVVGAVLLCCCFQVSRLVAGVIHNPNRDYWQMVGWIRQNAPAYAHVMGSPVLNLSTSRQSYDFFRPINSYGPYGKAPIHSVESVVGRFRIDYLLVDQEWKIYQSRNMADFVARHGEQVAKMGDLRLYRIKAP